MSPSADFTLADFQRAIRQIRKLGSMGQILKMIPGLRGFADIVADMNPDQDMTRIDGIINSMTPWERAHPEQIDRRRRNRIAQGSGTDPADINRLIKDFNAMAPMMKDLAGMGMRDRMRAVKELAFEKHNFRLVTAEDFDVSDGSGASTQRPWWLLWQRSRPPSDDQPQ